MGRLKGYITNTNLTGQEVIENYNLWIKFIPIVQNECGSMEAEMSGNLINFEKELLKVYQKSLDRARKKNDKVLCKCYIAIT